MKIKKYIIIAEQEVKNMFSNLWNKLFSIVILWVVLFVFIHLWLAIYKGKSDIIGYTFVQFFWYFTLTEVINFSNGIDMIEDIGEEVRTGKLASSLLKPINYCLSKYFKYIATSIINFFLIGFGGVIFTYLFVGPINVSVYGILLTAIAVFFRHGDKFYTYSCNGFVCFLA